MRGKKNNKTHAKRFGTISVRTDVPRVDHHRVDRFSEITILGINTVTAVRLVLNVIVLFFQLRVPFFQPQLFNCLGRVLSCVSATVPFVRQNVILVII